jgi:methyl-accepting chemotaxis protein
MKTWTFGRTLTVGFIAVLVLNLVAGVVALISLHNVVESKDRVIAVDTTLRLRAEQLLALRAQRGAAFRAYLLTGDETFAKDIATYGNQFNALITRTRSLVHTTEGTRLLNGIAAATATYDASQDRLIAQKRAGDSLAEMATAFQGFNQQRTTVRASLTAFSGHEDTLATAGVRASNRQADHDMRMIMGLLAGAGLLTLVIAVQLTRWMRRRIGNAVGDVANSSSELQGTANQQAVGAMQQATAMSEISTTITELLATSRQITESAQRVSDVAAQTTAAGQNGQTTMASATETMAEIRRQVDTIVNHILELGDKSQRIGSVLDIVSELSEQTNILAINSTIEAAGAGEAGRRFTVVAEEIRKLADRVAESTKEIRDLIDVVRGAVHTTVIATEIGSKAVDAGSAQFAGVTASFQQIVDLVTTTTEAAREIELSTKQQTTAVEQVNFAVANVTETTKETESNSTRTLRNASQLSELSASLRRLIEPTRGQA